MAIKQATSMSSTVKDTPLVKFAWTSVQ